MEHRLALKIDGKHEVRLVVEAVYSLEFSYRTIQSADVDAGAVLRNIGIPVPELSASVSLNEASETAVELGIPKYIARALDGDVTDSAKSVKPLFHSISASPSLELSLADASSSSSRFLHGRR